MSRRMLKAVVCIISLISVLLTVVPAEGVLVVDDLSDRHMSNFSKVESIFPKHLTEDNLCNEKLVGNGFYDLEGGGGWVEKWFWRSNDYFNLTSYLHSLENREKSFEETDSRMDHIRYMGERYNLYPNISGFKTPIDGGILVESSSTGGPNSVHNINTGEDFSSIQAAIDDPDTRDGDTILVDPGVYFENIIIYKSIHLIGEDRESTIIDGGHSQTPKDVIKILADEVSISGFTIQNSWLDNTGIKVLSNHNIISDCIIKLNFIGVYLSSSSNNTLEKNVITLNSDYGVYLSSSNDNILQDNLISSNWKDTTICSTMQQYASGGGIFLSNSINNIIVNNVFVNDSLSIEFSYENILSGRYHNSIYNNIVNHKPLIYLEDESHKTIDYKVGQIILMNCNNIVIKSQRIQNTDVAIELWNTYESQVFNSIISENVIGVFLHCCKDTRVSHNTIEDNYFGIIDSVSESVSEPKPSHNKIQSNNFSFNKNGLMLVYSLNCEVSDNMFFSNSESGIFHYSSVDSNISDNNFLNNKEAGIYLYSSWSSTFSRNHFSNNSRGIYILYSLSDKILKNSFLEDGIYIDPWYEEFSNDEIYDNMVNNKPLVFLEGKTNLNIDRDVGQVILKNCSNITLQGANISHTIVGIQLLNTHNCIISNNNLSLNRKSGITLCNSNNNLISNNTISNNTDRGIYLLFGSNRNMIFNNTIVENGNDGINVGGSSSCKNNYILDNFIAYNRDCGISCDLYLFDANDCIFGNTIIGNHFAGIFLSFSNGINISKNDIENNQGYGIYFFIVGDSIISNNKILNNHGCGIHLFGSSGIRISKNNISKNQEYGINLCCISNNNTISNNIINNQRSGILLEDSDNNILNCNIISTSRRNGIEIYRSSYNLICNCVIQDNYKGIELRESSRNTITKCIISNNTFCSIYNSHSENNHIKYNDFIENYADYINWHGEKNFFFRNYWSGRLFQLPIPYVVSVNWKTNGALRLTVNIDWFPRVEPYIFGMRG